MNLAALSLLDEGEHGAGNQASSWENHDAGGREAGLNGSQEGTALGKVPSVPVATACPRALLWLHLGLVATPLSAHPPKQLLPRADPSVRQATS